MLYFNETKIKAVVMKLFKIHKCAYLAVTIFIIFFSADITARNILYDRILADIKEHLNSETGTLRAKLESEVTKNLLLIYSASTYVSINPEITSIEFDNLSKKIMETDNSLFNIVAAPNFEIRYVYPLQGNEKILGVNYRNIPNQWEQAEKAKREHKMIIAGPLNLIQGGVGVIGRVPVFEDNGAFWGLVSSVIDFDKMIAPVEKYAQKNNLKIAIRGRNGLGEKGEVFYGDKALFENNNNVAMDVSLPDGKWQITAEYTGQKYELPIQYTLFIHFINIVTGIFIFIILRSKFRKDRAVKESEQRFKDVAMSSSDWVWEVNEKFQYTFASGKVKEILGYDPDELLGKNPTHVMEDDEAKRVASIVGELVQTKSPIVNLENWNITKTGNEVCLLTNGVPVFDEDGIFRGYRGVDKDITAQKNAEKELQMYIDIVDKNVITSQTDLDGNITYASKAFCEISGYTKEELIGKNHNIVRHPDMKKEIFEDMWQTLKSGISWIGEIKNLKKDGGFYWVDTSIHVLSDRKGRPCGYMAVRQDITSKKVVEKLSVTDRLTGIYNRVKLDEVISAEHSRFERYKTEYSIIMFDIDFFKKVNDTYGHLTGDEVLKKVAVVVPEQIRNIDVFGRWGGEEFLIICPGTTLEGAVVVAENIRKTIEATSFDEAGNITCSFGVGSISNTFEHEELLKKTDEALYSAKKAGRNCVKSFEKS